MKYRFVENLLGAGIDNIEVSSFVRADRIPQLSDAAEHFQMIYNNKLAGNFSALIPNIKGLNRAIECRANRFAVFTASSEIFNQKKY